MPRLFKKRVYVFLGVCLVILGLSSLNAKEQDLNTPKNAVQSLYQAYLSAKGPKTENRLMHSYFSDDLYALYVQQIKKDAALNEVGCINDFDVITGSQERPIHFSLVEARNQGRQAQVLMRFDFGPNSHSQLRLDLRLEQGRWLIDDLMYQDIGQSLRQMIAACQSS